MHLVGVPRFHVQSIHVRPPILQPACAPGKTTVTRNCMYGTMRKVKAQEEKRHVAPPHLSYLAPYI